MENNFGNCCIIREAFKEDAQILSELIRDSFRTPAELFHITPENVPQHPSNCRPEWVESDMNKGIRYFVLEENGSPRGCVAMEQGKPGVVYLERLAVLPQARRRGFGEALVRHVLQEARKNGAVRVQIGVIAEHEELRRWYEKLGFTVKRTVKYAHLPFNGVFMDQRV